MQRGTHAHAAYNSTPCRCPRLRVSNESVSHTPACNPITQSVAHVQHTHHSEADTHGTPRPTCPPHAQITNRSPWHSLETYDARQQTRTQSTQPHPFNQQAPTCLDTQANHRPKQVPATSWRLATCVERQVAMHDWTALGVHISMHAHNARRMVDARLLPRLHVLCFTVSTGHQLVTHPAL